LKKKIGYATIALILLSSTVASAHPGRTDASGGHHCWTNCERWGLSYGEYHYHNGGGGSSSKTSSSKSTTRASSKPQPKPKAPTYAKSHIKVYVNGSLVKFGSHPLIYNNTNLVPLREIAEGMGAKVSWNKEAGAIGVQRGTHKVTLTIGSRTAFYNGKAESIAVAPKVIDGVTYVPLQVFARGLGANVSYSARDGIVKISY